MECYICLTTAFIYSVVLSIKRVLCKGLDNSCVSLSVTFIILNHAGIYSQDMFVASNGGFPKAPLWPTVPPGGCQVEVDQVDTPIG